WLPYLPGDRTRPLSCTWQTTRATARPQILLTNLKFSDTGGPKPSIPPASQRRGKAGHFQTFALPVTPGFVMTLDAKTLALETEWRSSSACLA
ncbi:MAG: hypothetical protein H6Q33_4950, partial [Deltaproteobacteria bacterium]|nr:hypothetical protein [Deltaproteobacteria bacterium]